MFTSWVDFFENELSEIVSFFSAVFSLFPSRLLSILFMGLALSFVFGLVRYVSKQLSKGGD